MTSAKAFRSTSFIFSALSLGAAALAMSGCSVDPGVQSSGKSSSLQAPIGPNVMQVTVNGSLCGAPGSQYANEPCVAVTICSPGTTQCQTINNILLDTGSYGLRVFGSALQVPLQPVTNNNQNVAECVGFGDGSSEWGQVEYADVVLGSEPASHVPIQVIQADYATAPGPCSASQSRPDTSPAQTGFNGILGVGLYGEDCGSTCADDASNGQYYVCTGSTCTESELSESLQVTNPVALIPKDSSGIADNNGVLLRLPDVASDGDDNATGWLVLGIGTRPNNQPSGVTTYPADSNGDFSTVFSNYGSTPITSFIDSGSSVLFFPPPSGSVLPDCNSAAGGGHGDSYAGFYCPATDQSFTAQNISVANNSKGDVPFEVSNAYNLFLSGHLVFSNIADSSDVGSSAVFDWGLPFFFGRNVYVGIEPGTKTVKSPLGSGPYWAY